MRSLGQIRLGADLFLFSIYQCIKGLSLKIQHTRWFFLKNGLLGSAARWKPKCVEKRSRLFSQQPISRHLGNSLSQSRDVFSSRHFCYWRKKCIKWKLLPALKGELDRYMRDDDNEENFLLRIRISAWLVFFSFEDLFSVWNSSDEWTSLSFFCVVPTNYSSSSCSCLNWHGLVIFQSKKPRQRYKLVPWLWSEVILSQLVLSQRSSCSWLLGKTGSI